MSKSHRLTLAITGAGIIAASVFAISASASPTRPTAPSELQRTLESDLSRRPGTSFGALVKSWESRHGASAVDPLVRIAGDSRRTDADRYVAVMAAAKLGGPAAAPRLLPFLTDRSWMLRTAGLRAVSALGLRNSQREILPLLSDRALVVRSEAVQAIRSLRLANSAPALISALRNPANYHQGKALWVTHEILDALVALQAREHARELKPLLRHDRDPELQRHAIATLAALTDRTVGKGLPLREQARAWEKTL